MTSRLNKETDLTPGPDLTPNRPPLTPPKEGNKIGEGRKVLAEKIAHGILTMQGNISNRVNRFSGLKLFLVSFCVLSGTLSIYFFVEAIGSKPNNKIKVERISTPVMIDEPTQLFDEKIPVEIYRDIQAYKRYMDSVGEMIRPGLTDSMRVLEEMYLQQQK